MVNHLAVVKDAIPAYIDADVEYKQTADNETVIRITLDCDGSSRIGEIAGYKQRHTEGLLTTDARYLVKEMIRKDV